MSPPNCIIIPLQSKVVDPTSTPSCYSRLSCYNRRILPFLNVKVKEGIEHVSHKEEEEEGMEVDRGTYGAFMHGSTMTTLNVPTNPKLTYAPCKYIDSLVYWEKCTRKVRFHATYTLTSVISPS